MKLILLITGLLFLGACSTQAPNLNMLEKEADYHDIHKLEKSLSSAKGELLVPARTEAKVTDIWVHPHEMPTGDYFRGGWVRTIISHATWKMEAESPLFIKKSKKNRRKNQRK